VFGDQLVGRMRKVAQQSDDAFVRRGFSRNGRISEGHARVANQASPLGAFDGTVTKYGAEFLLRERGQPFELGGEKRFAAFVWRHLLRGGPVASDCARLKSSDGRDRSFPVPGADVLADIATDDRIADGGTKFLGNRGAKFDGQVGDAPARVKDVRRGKSLGRRDRFPNL